MADLKAMAESLVNLTVKEVNELTTILKDDYGIEPAAAAVVMAAPGAAAAEEKTSFDVVLTDAGLLQSPARNIISALQAHADKKSETAQEEQSA